MQTEEAAPPKDERQLPLTSAQKELWLLSQLDGRASVAYNVSYALELRGDLLPEALRLALQDALDRHEALRARVGGDAESIAIAGRLPLDFHVEDVSSLPAAAQRDRLRAAAAKEFDLAAAPLFAATLFRTGPGTHVLLLASHHIVVDGASMATLFHELGELYSARCEGRDHGLPPPSRYAAHVEQQEQVRTSPRWSAAEQYWLSRFREVPAALDLPADRPRPGARTFRGASETFTIEPALVSALESLGRRHGATLFMTLFAGFACLVRRLSGRDGFVLGINISGRSGRAGRRLVGYLTRLLPIRVETAQEWRVPDLLGHVRDTLVAAFEHRDYTLGDLIRALSPDRSPARSPLVDVVFNFDRGAEGFRFAGLETRLLPVPASAAKYDIDFNVIEEAGGLRCDVEYSTDLFEAETIRRLLVLWRNLLASFVAAPDAPLLALPWLDDDERHEVLVEWNRTETASPPESLVEALAAQARRDPAGLALVCDGAELRYGELNAMANRLARHLRSLGAGREVRVGVCLERGLDWVVSILAVWKAGGVYVPLDVSYPKERLAFMLADAGVTVLVTESAIAPELPSHAARTVCVDMDREAVTARSDEDLGLRTEPGDLAYVMYTSGSTGRPKGAMVEHRGMMNHLRAKVDDLQLAAGDVVAQNAPASFDVSVWQVFAVLLAGGHVQIIGEEIAREGTRLLGEAHALGVTVLQTVPALLGMMIEDQEARGAHRLDLSAMRWMISNAEPLPVSMCERWRALYPRVALVNAYGPTECSDDVTHLHVELPLAGLTYAPLGGRLRNTRLYVLDELMQPEPIGVAGELYIGGSGVGRGYVGRPGQTAGRFVPDPFGVEAGARLYRTGDRVRLLRDGTCDFLGRVDRQVKLRGLRVELPEIEGALDQHPAVLHSAVIVREDEPGDRRLVAYVVGRAGTTVDTGSLRAHLRQRLPDYMVPGAIVVLDRMPLTANEKVDREALPRPEPGTSGPDGAFRPPRNHVERVLAELWAHVLRVDRVGIDDNFFALGGHSLLATHVMSRIRQGLQAELPLRRLFEAPTIAELAQAVEEARAEWAPAPPGRIARVPRDQPLPLSSAQQRLWFLRQFETDEALYNMLSVLRIEGDLQVPVLARAVDEIVRRHEVLRTIFLEEQGIPVQIVNPPAPIGIPVTDLEGCDDAARRQRIQALTDEEVHRPFDLTRGPLLRLRLARVGPAEHLLLLGMHHIVGDGWSLDVFLQELADLYDAFVAGKPSPLAELPFQYADYAAWERQWLESEAVETQLEYWRTQLDGMPQVLDLPTIGPRPSAPSHHARQHTFLLSQELTGSLLALSGRHSVTLFTTLLAGFQALISRYTGRTDIVVGGSTAGRNLSEVESLIGFFVNALVLRTDLSGSPTVDELLRRVAQVMFGAYANQDVPFDRLVEALQPQRDMTRTPLFQVGFDLQRPMSMKSAALTITEEGFEFPMEKFDLSLRMVETGGGLQGLLLYQTELFDEDLVAGLARHYERLLEGIVAAPGRRIDEIDLGTPAERGQALQANATERAYPDDCGVHELVAAQAARAPEATAVVHGSVRMPYGELERRANQLARYLQARGVGAEARVGLCLERGVDWVVGLLGILKAGAAYVPLDPGYPNERLELMVDDARTALVLTEEAFEARFFDTRAETICLEQVRDAAGALSGAPVERQARGDDLAYVMYTSGSTGTPKGIMVPHRAIARLVRETDYVALGPVDRVAQVSTASFDAATFEVWGALANGAALVVIDKDLVLSPPDLARTLQRERVTTIFLTTALFNQAARQMPGAFRGLRHVLFGGEAVDPRSARDVMAGEGPERLLHVYGPTETTTFATWHPVTGVAPACRTIPIGRPIANTRVYVLDEWLRPAPPGLPGEIYIGGPGVARGYWARPRLTAERFVPDPFSAAGGARLYRTGDTARYRPDGAIEFLGRVDDQVKLRGYRIELGEIEAVLKQHEAVQDAVVVLRDEAGERQLAGYVVGRPGSELRVATLVEWLQRRLPEYMVPSAVVVLAGLPLTANGKVDRDALPAPTREDHGLEEYAAPRTGLEAALCRIWTETLQVDRVGTADNFFELGGHSLLATRVMSRVRSDLGAELGLRALFEWPTVEGLARRVEEALAQGALRGASIVPVDRTGDLPLSYAQSRLWFIHRLQPHSVAYNAPFHLRLAGDMDHARLDACLSEIVRRHEVLRTTFPARDGQPVQQIHPPHRLESPLVDLSALPGRARTAVAARLRQEDGERLFDLAAGPLLRATLLRLGPREHQLLLATHHIVMDGWSLPILLQELFALWNAYGQGRSSPLPEPELQYADYAVWQQASLEQDVLKTQLPYWRQQLQHVPPLDLPTDRPRPPATTHPGAELLFSLGPDLSARLAEWSQREGVTLFMALLAAFQWLLSRYAMQEDVAVGTVIANRNRKEVEGLLGFFVNALVLRTDVSGSPSFRELVRRVRDVTTAAYTHQDLPFEKLVEELNPARDLGRSPLFQVRFTLDNEPPPLPAVDGLQVDNLYVELPEVKFDLTMAMQNRADGILEGCAIYAADLFDRRTVEGVVEQYERLLGRVMAEPDAPLAGLPLAGDEERRQVLAGFNPPALEAADDRCVHELVEEIAALMPGATAVVYEGVRLSYAAVDAKANQVAHVLRDLGVGPEVRVGIFIERSLDLVIGLLGILKAGSAYVPIDPATPRQRLASLLQEARLPVLLTTERLQERLPAQWIHVVCLDADREIIASHPTTTPVPMAHPGNLAYVIHTSGSTGAPKAVGIEHRQLAGYVRAVSRAMECAPGWKFAFLSSVAADLGNTALFASLCGGGELHVISEERARDGRRLGAYFREEAIDCTKITPSHFAGLQPAPDLMPARLLVFGGEALTWTSVDQLSALGAGCRLMNHYGPTECTVGAAACRLDEAPARTSATVPLGRPLRNSQVYVLDDSMQPLPAGFVGEIYIGGAGVARGYLDRPALSAGRFVPDPFGDRPGARLYRTGDKARWRPDGVLEFLGRADDQVKIRGFRVEPAEIASVLGQHPGVGQAAVMPCGDGRLAAYVSPRRSGEAVRAPAATEALAAELRAYLKERVPEYMVPGAVVVLPALPLTPGGKVDRRALPVADADAAAGPSFVPPATPVEESICAIWAEVLGRERISTQDDFFALGGHSLLATQAVARIESTLGVEVPLATMFVAPTVAELGREVERLQAEATHGPAPPLVALNRDAFARS